MYIELNKSVLSVRPNSAQGPASIGTDQQLIIADSEFFLKKQKLGMHVANQFLLIRYSHAFRASPNQAHEN